MNSKRSHPSSRSLSRTNHGSAYFRPKEGTLAPVAANIIREVIFRKSPFFIEIDFMRRAHSGELPSNISVPGASILRPRDARYIGRNAIGSDIRAEMEALSQYLRPSAKCFVGRVAISGAPRNTTGSRYVSLVLEGEGAEQLQSEREMILEHFDLMHDETSTPQISFFRSDDREDALSVARKIDKFMEPVENNLVYLGAPRVISVRMQK